MKIFQASVDEIEDEKNVPKITILIVKKAENNQAAEGEIENTDSMIEGNVTMDTTESIPKVRTIRKQEGGPFFL